MRRIVLAAVAIAAAPAQAALSQETDACRVEIRDPATRVAVMLNLGTAPRAECIRRVLAAQLAAQGFLATGPDVVCRDLERRPGGRLHGFACDPTAPLRERVLEAPLASDPSPGR